MTVLSDIERREKKEVMGKLHEMEKELKVGWDSIISVNIDHSDYFYSFVNKDDIRLNIRCQLYYYLSLFVADSCQIE